MNSYQSNNYGRNHKTAETQYLLMNSVTYAMKAQRTLERRGFRAFVLRDRGINPGFGCGYAVKLYGDERTLSNAKAILSGAGIPFREYARPEEAPPEGGGDER